MQNTGAAKSVRQKANKETDKAFERSNTGKEQDNIGDSEGNGRDDGEVDIEADYTSSTGQKRHRAKTDDENKNVEVPSKKKSQAQNRTKRNAQNQTKESLSCGCLTQWHGLDKSRKYILSRMLK